MKKPSWSPDAQWAAVFAAVLLFNLSMRSVFFNFDGVACAIAVELSDFKHLVHGNHLAYGVVAWAFNAVWRFFGYKGQALYTLQVLDSVLGAAGAAMFASLLRRMGRGERESVLGAAALAVCHAWWFWSLEAQVYMLGALFAVMAAREALDDHPRPQRVGLWHAFAVLGHVGHVMAFPALAFALTYRKDRRAINPYGMTLCLTVLAAYALAAVFAIRPAGMADVKLWLMGSAALGVDRAFVWHSVSIGASLKSWSGMSLRIFTEFVGQHGFYWSVGLILAALPVIAAVRGALDKNRESIFWLLWLAGYALLFTSWEPYTIVYRVTDLLALLALATLGLRALPERWRLGALAAWTAAAFAFNLAFVVRPAAEFSNNPDLVEAEWTKTSTPPEAWVLANGRGAVYIPYFSGRRPVNLRYLTDEKLLTAKLDELAAAGQSVYVSGRTLNEEGLRAKLDRYGLTPSSQTAGLSMFRVARLK